MQRPAMANAPTTPPPAPIEIAETTKRDAAPPRLPPRSSTPVASGVAPAVQRKGAESIAPARIETGDEPLQVVAKFYRALSVADGKSAAAVIVPAKRGIGPYNESRMSKFYGSFEEPLLVRSIRQIDDDTVEARYRYRVSRTACEGVAQVKTERVLQQTLIRSIRANC
jgi:hypothetical protein